MKCVLVDGFQWSLHDIDRTDIESLIPFVFHFPRFKQARKDGNPTKPQIKYADEITWM
ncbi:MAG: hypothetical protein ABI904_23215 [Chloroflexota bacterium]